MTHRCNAEHQHKEALCLMWYQCERCEMAEQFWNSRDGVTPFMVSGACLACGGDMCHVNWRDDDYRPAHIPGPGIGVFFDMPESFKRPIAAGRVNAAGGTKFEVQGQERAEMIEAVMQDFRPGAPWFLRW